MLPTGNQKILAKQHNVANWTIILLIIGIVIIAHDFW